MYRILRNNKEQGPYKLDELVQLSLRPYDLVWIEGKSACWRYPSEIEELMPYISGSPITTVSSQPVPQSVMPATTKVETSLSGTTLEQDEPELTAAMLEEKANAIYQRVQAYNAKCAQEAKDVQTKYARSLEDLKQDYADWLHGKKHKKRELNTSNKGWVAFGAVSAAFIIFVLAGKDKENVWPVHKQNEKTQMTSTNDAQAKTKNVGEASAVEELKLVSEQATVVAFIDSMRNVLRKNDLSSKSGLVKDKPVKKKKSDPQIAIHPIYSVLPPLKEVVKTPSIKAADLDAKYIPGENNSRIKEVQVTVHNTGTVALKQVTVDVFYYKKGERLLDKETLYFSDIGPGNSFTLSKPGNRKAVFARFELGELTADN